ncbi:MAG TPA: DNA repair protein RecO [Spirochaetota bacterium]|nr:DNA repair protein RecO [Spirochaetota bacterium]HPS87135.1 DNA repair protein RecO [Spirochaetota bacterium]
MSQEKDTGIVLSKKSSGEADDICSIFTRNSGKDRFIFKGLKKSTKRPRTASEPGSILDILYYTGKAGGFSTISGFDILATHNSIRKSSEKIFSLYFILELVDLTTGPADPNPKIFNLLSAGIETLSGTLFPKHFAVFFTIKYLLLQGVFPDTEKCSWCGISDPDKLVVENNGLRVSCIGCTDFKSAVIRSRGTEFINKCVKLKLDKIECGNYPEKDIIQVLTTLIEYINSYYSIKLKSGSMLTRTVIEKMV